MDWMKRKERNSRILRIYRFPLLLLLFVEYGCSHSNPIQSMDFILFYISNHLCTFEWKKGFVIVAYVICNCCSVCLSDFTRF